MIACGIYTTNRSETCVYIANHSEAQVVVVDSEKQYHKYVKAGKKPKTVRYYVFITPEIPAGVEGENVLSWSEVMKMGKLTHEKHKIEIDRRSDSEMPGTVCCYVYTSGTTSMPKACLLTHDSIISSTYSLQETYDRSFSVKMTCRNRIVSFMPLSHVAAMDVDMLMNMLDSSIIYFAAPDALKGSLLTTIREVRPTIFLAVPRIYEKLQEGIMKTIMKGSALSRKIVRWAMGVGTEATANQLKGLQNPFGFALAKSLVFDKIKKQLGLDQAHAILVGGGATLPAVYDFFASLNIKLAGLYGLSEISGSATYAFSHCTKLYASGRVSFGAVFKVDQPDDRGEGEICYRGRGLFAGYLKDAETSRKAFDKDGFYHSGDLGYIDSDGYLFVTGRIKELLKTSGGENIAPLLLENAFPEICPISSNIVVVGDKRHYLTALITLKGVPQTDTSAPQLLDPETQEAVQKLGSKARTAVEASRCPRVLEYMDECVRKLNKKAISHAQQIRKWRILPREFMLEEGEVTPTMKLKRYVIYKKYANVIEELYGNKAIPKL